MKRPRTMGFAVYAMCICLSTIALQALTSPSPAPSFFSHIDSLWGSSVDPEPTDLTSVDLKVRNLSVHRVRYVDEQGDDQDPPAASNGVANALNEMLAQPRRTEVSSVVATWEDHPLAAHARAKDERLEDDSQEQVEGSSYQYELQVWVSGWGLDGLWNPANRRIKTRDPFLVLLDLPLQHELRFRVRIKAQQTKRSLLGYLLPMGFFATETDGPYSEAVTLSPTRDDELEAIVAFLTGNKPFLFLLAVCIGSGSMVVAQLYLQRRLARHRQRKQLRKQKTVAESESGDSGKSKQELEHEIRDLRQELADSEEEVRQLMLFSGYGIESLAPHELEQLERELKNTLKRVQHLRKHPGMSKTVNADERDRALLAKQRATRDPLHPIYEHRSF